MSYRDDREALIQRLAALERQAQRAEQLEQRVRELEQENQALRKAMAGEPTTRAPSPEAGPLPASTGKQVYVDTKIHDYITKIISATCRPSEAGLAALDEYILSGARPSIAGELIEAARSRAAGKGRAYVLPADIVTVAPAILRSHVILSGQAQSNAISVDAILEQLLAAIEAP